MKVTVENIDDLPSINNVRPKTRKFIKIAINKVRRAQWRNGYQ